MPETEWEYGCTRCQTWHGESDGPVYAGHIMWQAKHGLRRRPAGGWPATQAARTSVPAAVVADDNPESGV